MKYNPKIKKAINLVISTMMDRIMNNVLVSDPFVVDQHRAEKPLYAALVPDEIFKGSHFERRFVTPFGAAWEKLAIVAAEEGSGTAIKGHTITGNINTERLRRIQEVLNKLEHSPTNKERIRPDWKEEVEYILAGESASQIPTSVVCDVYVENKKTGAKYAFELKAPLPNSDQTKVSKEKILKLYAMEPKMVTEAFFALPYNPYGKKKDYAWSFPARWFDMKNDPVVLIGDEFWDKIGGRGTYRAFIEAVNEIGKDYKDRIYREYLGMEPPANGINDILK